MTPKLLRVLFPALLALLPVSAAMAAPAGQISDAKGLVTVTAPQESPVTVQKGAGVDGGQVITTGKDGQAVIKFQDGQTIALKSNSVFRIDNYKYDRAAPEKGESVFALLQGGLRAITGLIGQNNKSGWRLATSTATIGIRGTDFLVDGVYVKVTEGSIGATNSGGTAVFGAGQTGAITSASTLGTTIPASQVPAGVFTELEAIGGLGATGGTTTAPVGGTSNVVAGTSATGAGSAAGAAVITTNAVLIGAGVAAAGATAAGGKSESATSHPK